jgi:putative transposase
MLLRNDLLYYEQPQPRTVRVLWIAPNRGYACVFDVHATSAEVERVPMPALEEDLACGRARRLASDPYLVLQGDERLPPKHLALRARAWAIIEPLVQHEPDIYEPRRRGQLIARYKQLHGVSHPTVYRYLRRYWQRGQTPNALLPDYANSGARGKVRAASAGVKRGRPRKDGSDPGVNADEEIRRVFRVAAARHADQNPRFSRRAAYAQMVREFFRPRRIDEAAGRVHDVSGAPPLPAPSFGQFSYWLDQDHDRPANASRRVSRRGAAAAAAGAGQPVRPPVQAGAPIASWPARRDDAASAMAQGRPGDAYYLDAVRADVLLVSRTDRAQLLGRPLVYAAVDRFSGMITGLSVSLAAQPGPEGLLALANSGADKQRFCQRHGRAIEAAQWPGRHLPARLLAPPALARSWNGDTLLNNFNVRCAATPAVPSAWQAPLERRFRLLPHDAVGAANGSRLDGMLDLEEFTRIVIDCALFHNNAPPERAAALAHGDVAGTPPAMAPTMAPAALWDWGVAQHGVAIKPYPEQMVRCCLLPRTVATVTAEGIHLHGNYYTCARAIEEHWFERARLRGQWSITVGYDPADMDVVYLPDTGAALHFHVCHLLERSRAHRRLSALEIILHQERRRYLRERIEQAVADDLRRSTSLRLSAITG